MLPQEKITSDLKWNVNTEHIVRMGFKKLWILRRLKANGANRSEIWDIHLKYVKSLLEYSTVVWHSALTELNRIDLEQVQQAAFSIILGSNYDSY